jgi:hypothetical protein
LISVSFAADPLEWSARLREIEPWLLWLYLLRLSIGLMFYYYGQDIVKRNNLLLIEYENQKSNPFKMAPFILIGTVITHLLVVQQDEKEPQ